MAIYVLLRNDEATGAAVDLLQNSRLIYWFLKEIRDTLQEQFPQIYDSAFAGLDCGDVYLADLNADEFNQVYQVSKTVYEPLKSGTSPMAVNPHVIQACREYMEALEQDPRFRATDHCAGD